MDNKNPVPKLVRNGVNESELHEPDRSGLILQKITDLGEQGHVRWCRRWWSFSGFLGSNRFDMVHWLHKDKENNSCEDEEIHNPRTQLAKAGDDGVATAFLGDKGDNGVNDALDYTFDEFAESAADDDTDREIDHVAFECEVFEF